MKPRRPWDDASYRQRRALLMASVTEQSKCWRCGKLAHEHPQTHKSGRRAGWQAGHTVDGDNTAPLALEWSTCNVSAGASLGHHRAFGRFRDAAERPSVGPHNPMHYAPDGWMPCRAVTGEMCLACRDWHATNPNPRRG